MFVRWKTVEPREEKWFNHGDGPYYRAYLVQSVRIHGKPRQKQIYLGAIKAGCLEETYDRAIFWKHVQKVLKPLHLEEAQLESLSESLEKRVPFPSVKEVDDYKYEVTESKAAIWEELEAKAEEAFLAAFPEHTGKDDLWWWRSGMWEVAKGKRSAYKNDSLEIVGTTGE